MMQQKKWLHWLGVGLFASLAFVYSLHKINLTTADLGRHLTNGRIFLEQQTLVSTNYYSYTLPDQLVTNHHWLSGVVFYLIFQHFGFSGLSFFYAGLFAIAFTFFFLIGKSQTKWWLLILTIVLFLPLASLRSELRPEVFSFLFLGFEIWLLLQVVKKRLFKKWVWVALGVMQILWVNLHLFFFLSWGVAGAMLIQMWLLKDRQASIFLLKLLGLLFLASFVSPFGYKSVLEPFLIWRDFGYKLAENQTLIFMLQRFGSGQYWHGLFAVGLSIVAMGEIFWGRQKQLTQVFSRLLLGSFAIFAFVMNRFVPMLGLMLIGFGSEVLSKWLNKSEVLEKSLVPFISVFLFFIFISSKNYLSPFNHNFGAGLLFGVEQGGEFFRAEHLSGPIFNNYDIGGYLIYELFPSQRVFVDNRPEAYSSEFFQRYIRAQEDEEEWQVLDEEYGFETIFFYRHDFTPWAQPFLVTRLGDQSWVPVYVDEFILILVKNNERNKQVIEEFKLSKEMFVVK